MCISAIVHYIGADSLRSSRFRNTRNKFRASPSFRLRSENREMSFPSFILYFLKPSARHLQNVCVSRVSNFFFIRIADFYNVGKSQRKSTRLKMQLRDNRKIHQSSSHAAMFYPLSNSTKRIKHLSLSSRYMYYGLTSTISNLKRTNIINSLKSDF